MLKWTRKLAVLWLAASMLAAPLLACMAPDHDLTAEERECCKDMADECGQMDMPASHSCCKESVRPDGAYAVSSRFTFSVSQEFAALPIADREQALPADPNLIAYLREAHAPPVSPPEVISVLRI